MNGAYIEPLSSEMYVSVRVVLGVRVVHRPANSGAGRSRGHAAVCSRARGGGHGRAAGQRRAADDSDSEDEASFQSYDDPDDGESPVPPFTAGFQLPGYYTRGSLTTAYSFFKLLFPDNMIHSIVDHTNSYAQEKIFSGLRSSYTISDGSLQDVTADEI